MNFDNLFPFGFGTMKINNNQAEVNRLVEYAISQGVNYFELCYFYAGNNCETLISNALTNYNRADYYLCNKLPQSIFRNMDQKEIELFFENRLRASNTDYFDYFLLQCVTEESYQYITKELLDFFDQKKQQGIIRHFGFSYHGDADSFQKVIDLYPWDMVQLQINYYDWYEGIAKDLYFIAKKNNLPIFVMQPCKSGMLINDLALQSKERLKEEHLKPNDLCYKFLFTLSQVKVILNGVDNINNLKDNLQQFKQNHYGITQFEKQQILLNIQEYKQNSWINCSNCEYCKQVCPQQIPISDLFKNYNLFLRDQNNLQAREYLYYQNSLTGGMLSVRCIACGRCEKACPQRLPIQKLIKSKIRNIRR